MIEDLRAVAFAASSALERYDADPLSGFDWPSHHHRDATAYACDGLEAVLRAANYAGKTLGMGAPLAIAFARGMRELGGVRLPTVETPNVGAIVVRSHKVQVDSSQAALLHWLGNDPSRFHVSWLRRQENVASAIWVRPDGHASDDWNTWSRMVFMSQADGEQADQALGARWLYAWGDEPPIEKFWRETRKNTRFRWITYTPLELSKYEWIQGDFVGTTRNPRRGRVEVVATLYDNKFLDSATIARKENEFAGDDFERARRYGEYVDAEGASPWGQRGMAVLDRMSRTAGPGELLRFTLPASVRDGPLFADVEYWEDPDPFESYYIPADPSLGVEDDEHDPCGLHVYGRRSGRLVARFGEVDRKGGYLPAESLGHLMAQVARYWRGCEGEGLCDPEIQGGYGEAVLVGLRAGGHRRIARDDRERTNRMENHYGFKTNNITRGLYLAAAQEALYQESMHIPSPDVISNMVKARLDRTGKPVKGASRRFEDVILFGRAAHYLATVPAPPIRQEREPMTEFGRLIESMRPKRSSSFGVEVPDDWS